MPDTHVDTLRRNLGLNAIDTSTVNLVTTKHICASAASAIDRRLHVRTGGRKVYVFGAAPATGGGVQRYFVVDTTLVFGPLLRVWVFNSAFQFVGTLSR